MKEVLVNTAEYTTSVGVYRRESHMIVDEYGGGTIKHRKFLDGKEYPTVVELEKVIGPEKYKILSAEVEKLANEFDLRVNMNMCKYD